MLNDEAQREPATHVYIDTPWTCNTTILIGIRSGPGVISQYLDYLPPSRQASPVTRKDGTNQYTIETSSPVTVSPGKDLTVTESPRVPGISR